jgi:cytochrome c-type biogenesis protein CcmH
MMPTRKLSSLDRWRLIARVSRSGNAVPQPGDLEGSVEVGRAEGNRVARIVISRQR